MSRLACLSGLWIIGLGAVAGGCGLLPCKKTCMGDECSYSGNCHEVVPTSPPADSGVPDPNDPHRIVVTVGGGEIVFLPASAMFAVSFPNPLVIAAWRGVPGPTPGVGWTEQLDIRVAEGSPVVGREYSCGNQSATAITYQIRENRETTDPGGSCAITLTEIGTSVGQDVVGTFRATVVSASGSSRDLTAGSFRAALKNPD